MAAPLVAPGHALGAPATPAPTTPTPATSPTPAPTISPTATPRPLAPPWVQALRPIALWSGPDDQAIQFGIADRWDYFQIARPQQGSRLFVFVARTKNYAWVDALSVGPSGPPPPGWPPPDAPTPPDDLSLGWLATTADTPLWSDPNGTLLLGVAPAWTPFKLVEPQKGARLLVADPFSDSTSYVDATAVGPIGAPAQIDAPGRWWGILAVDGANLRSDPTTKLDPLGQLPVGSPLVVSAWKAGEEVIPDNTTWAMLADGTYLYSSVLRPVALPTVPPILGEPLMPAGRWIDINLTHQVVIAYEGTTPVRVARTSTGRPGWETDQGVFRIQRRVEKEVMDSSTLLGLDAKRADYKVENVRWTQYFTPDGKALHENYWKPRDQFGIPSSHGCVGLVDEDAKFLWDWASVGTPLHCHY